MNLNNHAFIVVLWALCVLSALLVVWVVYQNRTLTNELVGLINDENKYRIEHGQYLLQERSMTSAATLEVFAQEELGLRRMTDKDMQVLP